MIVHPAYAVICKAMLAFSNDQGQANERALHVLHRLTEERHVTGGEWRHGVYVLPEEPSPQTTAHGSLITSTEERPHRTFAHNFGIPPTSWWHTIGEDSATDPAG